MGSMFLSYICCISIDVRVEDFGLGEWLRMAHDVIRWESKHHGISGPCTQLGIYKLYNRYDSFIGDIETLSSPIDTTDTTVLVM